MMHYTPNYCRSKYLKGNMYNQGKPNEVKQEFHRSRIVWDKGTYKKDIHGKLVLNNITSIPTFNKY